MVFLSFLTGSNKKTISMKKFAPIVEKYRNMGISADNIEYAVESVKRGAKRAHILENLNADYRGMSFTDASALLNELFAASGGEFKKENRGGYVYSFVLFVLGVPLAMYILYVFTYGGELRRPLAVFAGAISFNGLAIYLLIKSIRGKFRDNDQPFDD
jgi:hypothetical protein